MADNKIVIIDYGTGNHGSIKNMLKHLRIESSISSDPNEIEAADKLILPGVGAFDHGMKNLMDRGLTEILNKKVIDHKTPFLGICLGMQLLAQKSEEGRLPGLGWIDGEVVRFRFDKPNHHLKIPHMGWNQVALKKQDWLFEDMPDMPRFYFVHSYYFLCRDERTQLCQTEYGHKFTSAVAQDNIYGVQFHPEKSHKYGMKLLENFAGQVR